LRQHSNFEHAVPVLHVFEQIRQLIEGYLTVDKISSGYISARDCFEGFTDETWSVMKAGFDRDLGIVQQR